MVMHLMAKRPFSAPGSVKRPLSTARSSSSLMDRAGHPRPLLPVVDPSSTLRSAKEKGTTNASQRSPSTNSSRSASTSSNPQSRYPTNVVREESNGVSEEEVSRGTVFRSVSLYVRAYELVDGACWDKETFLPITFESATVRGHLLIRNSMAKLTQIHLLPQTPILTHPPPIPTHPLDVDELVHRQEGQNEQEDLGRVEDGTTCG
jgi:hypothetical protein